MPIFFNRVQRGNPRDESAPKKWYLVPKSIGLLKEKEVAKQIIADETTLNPKEAEISIYQLLKVIIRALLNGQTVQLDELGTLRLTFSADLSSRKPS